MSNLLSNLVNNLAGGIQKIKCKDKQNEKFCRACGIKYKDCQCCIECMNFKDNLIEYKCLCCNKYYQTIFDENLRKQFVNTYIYFTHDIKKFILLLRKGSYPYKYMHDQERFSETTSPDKENVYSHLNMEDITDANQTKRFCKDF